MSNMKRLYCTLPPRPPPQYDTAAEAKFLDVFPPCYSQSPLQTDFTLPCLEKSGLKLVCNVNILHRILNSDNSQDYAQKPQGNCTFMNSASEVMAYITFLSSWLLQANGILKRQINFCWLTSFYVHSRVDSNTFTMDNLIPESNLYPHSVTLVLTSEYTGHMYIERDSVTRIFLQVFSRILFAQAPDCPITLLAPMNFSNSLEYIHNSRCTAPLEMGKMFT